MFRRQIQQFAFLPFNISRRSKVKILPKEHYNDDETKYMSARKPGPSFTTDFFAFAHRKWTFRDILEKLKERRMKYIVSDQKFVPERHLTCGPDLSAANFLAFRGAKVKFKGLNKWITAENIKSGEIPSYYVKGFILEEIDASEVLLCYEGFENLYNLMGLKKLKLRNCEFIDDWCLHRFFLFASSLEYLDISGCKNVSERGLACLYQLKKLKVLVIENMEHIKNKELVCLLLQDNLPNCEFIGIDFNDPELLKRLEPYLE